MISWSKIEYMTSKFSNTNQEDNKTINIEEISKKERSFPLPRSVVHNEADTDDDIRNRTIFGWPK